MLEALSSDYVRTARASGLPTTKILFTYALRTALLPISSVLGMIFSFLLGSNVLIEQVFGWQGIGAYAVAILGTHFGVNAWLALAAGIVVAAAGAGLIGFFCVRLTRIYFAMLTLAFAQIVWAICFKWNELTGGEQGMPEIPYPDFGWLEASQLLVAVSCVRLLARPVETVPPPLPFHDGPLLAAGGAWTALIALANAWDRADIATEMIIVVACGMLFVSGVFVRTTLEEDYWFE